MTLINLDTLNAMLRVGPDFANLSIADLRAAYDAGGAASPPDPAVQHKRQWVGDVPVEIGIAPGSDAARTILYLHGGGYVIGSTQSHRGLVARLGAAAGARTVAPDYRLAPEHPFPAAIDDAVAVYRWLINGDTAPESIAVAGDSGGGGLVVAMLVRARDAGLPMPAAAVLFSPLTDLAAEGASMRDKAAQDPQVSAEAHRRLCAIYLSGEDPHNPLASPIYADLRGLPPMLIHVGTAEALLDDSLRLMRRAAIDDVAVELKAWPGLPHVWQTFALIFAEGQASIDEAGLFLRAHQR